MKKSKRGRKSKYKDYVKPYLEKITQWRRDGLDEKQIYANLKVSADSWIGYKKKYPELLEALKKGEFGANEQVENALFRLATGYIYEEEKVTKGGKEGDKVEITKKHQPPNVTAIIFWLWNRLKDRWQQRQITFEPNRDLNGNIIDEDFKRSKSILETLRREKLTEQGNDKTD
jgi:hypothetical protein